MEVRLKATEFKNHEQDPDNWIAMAITQEDYTVTSSFTHIHTNNHL